MDVIIAGGGTGGHLMPGIAVARESLGRAPGSRILFVGADRGIERRVVPEEGFPLVTLDVGGFKRTGWRRRIAHFRSLLGALVRAVGIVRGFRPDVAVGLGGYASFPVMAAAIVCRVPRLVMEQNVYPGLANRLVGRFADRVAVPDEAAAAFFGARAVVTGNPVRPEFKAIPARSAGSPVHVLVTGGSQGAESVNRAVVEALGWLRARGLSLEFVHQTGERQVAEVRRAYVEAGFEAEVGSFFPDFASRYAWADLIVCRAGATTVAEIRAAGRAALFIPLAFAADDHQRKNARAMVDAGAARMLDPEELSGELLAEQIAGLVSQPERLAELGERARALAVPDAEARIVDLIERIVGGERES
jgi:UDP-N-acetylglucosamine--N-acetylmuramyl-(pentapeptide) pyrophosphoryl-undecaprenol N-acetylglucosamine transferase